MSKNFPFFAVRRFAARLAVGLALVLPALTVPTLGAEAVTPLVGVDWLKAHLNDPSLVVLDIMLPGTSGFDLFRRLRRECDIPVIFISARGSEEDRVLGLELGADDYLAKPFSPRELVARVDAQLIRAKLGREAEAANRAKDEFLATLSHELPLCQRRHRNRCIAHRASTRGSSKPYVRSTMRLATMSDALNSRNRPCNMA